jgi:hypothetical protein
MIVIYYCLFTFESFGSILKRKGFLNRDPCSFFYKNIFRCYLSGKIAFRGAESVAIPNFYFYM